MFANIKNIMIMYMFASIVNCECDVKEGYLVEVNARENCSSECSYFEVNFKGLHSRYCGNTMDCYKYGETRIFE